MFIFLLHSCGPDRKSETRESFRGLVINKYKTGPCFGNIVIKDGSVEDTLQDMCFCAAQNAQVWTYVAINDSIYKNPGTLKINVIRNHLVKEFDYPECYR